MKSVFWILGFVLLVSSCNHEEKGKDIFTPVNWKKRSIALKDMDSLKTGSSYLSVYSEIYSVTEHRTIQLTVTVSLRNISATDTIYMIKGDYYNTKGNLIRSYFDAAIFLEPLETIEIVIEEEDTQGGSGANFIFDWAVPQKVQEPVFDAVMISTSGQQGISFTTQGIKR